MAEVRRERKFFSSNLGSYVSASIDLSRRHACPPLKPVWPFTNIFFPAKRLSKSSFSFLENLLYCHPQESCVACYENHIFLAHIKILFLISTEKDLFHRNEAKIVCHPI